MCRDGLGWLQLVLSPVIADKTQALPILVGRGEGVHASSGNIIEYCDSASIISLQFEDRFCGLVVIGSEYVPRGPGFDSCTSRFYEKSFQLIWEAVSLDWVRLSLVWYWALEVPTSLEDLYLLEIVLWLRSAILIQTIEVRGSTGVSINLGPPSYDLVSAFTREDSKACKTMVFDPQGKYFAWVNGVTVKIASVSTWKVITEITKPKISNLEFSPKGTYLMTWEPYLVLEWIHNFFSFNFHFTSSSSSSPPQLDVSTSVGRLAHPLPFLSISPNFSLCHALHNSPVHSRAAFYIRVFIGQHLKSLNAVKCSSHALHITPTNPTPGPNLHIWRVETGELVKEFMQKRQIGWEVRAPQWSSDEKICARSLNNDVLFYEDANFESEAHKIHGQRVGNFSLAPGTPPYHILCYIPGKSGQPSFGKLFQYPKFENTSFIASKSFFQADRVDMFWNKVGSAVLLMTSMEVDKSGSSYYGKQALHALTCKGETAIVLLSKEGPIYSVEWSPKCAEFCVVYGFIPAKATLFNLKCEPVFDFGTGPRNAIYYNPHGNNILYIEFYITQLLEKADYQFLL
uniref:Translation initiation factor beta propellor-like domain-containing protein n=1 Tax=Timema monikensis TaxID=170555 RepID=A0A7R9DYE8_9NEOP|nr:unnamed protein product [Timema monikensis]